MLKEGIFLGKRYEILERVGSGGMADVYKSKDHKLNRYVAVKVLKSDYRSDEVFIQKFVSEAQAAAGLMHPNVVNVYDVGQDRGLYYMVMELVEGITLKDYIEKKGRLSAKETISISIQMVTGIQAAHNQHIIHRDIKPQNIIISKDGKVKVTDFGIARATTSTHTISTNVMGSVHYTSPEQARGGVVDEKSDIYSAGITMYEMITGHVPFDGDSTVSVALKHLQEDIVSPAEEVPDIPYSLECIIMKCTQKSTVRRYQNCQQLIDDLKRSLVNPNGNFVNAGGAGTGNTATVVMSDEELRRIQNERYSQDDYDDDYDDDYNDDYDDDDYDTDYDSDSDYDDDNKYKSRKQNQRGRKKNNVDPNTKKIMKILMVVAAVVIALAAVFMIGKAAGIFNSVPGVVEEEGTEKVKVPDVVGMTKEDAIKELKKKSLGYRFMEPSTSDKYEKGEVMEQKTKAGTRVAKNTEIQLVESLGKEVKKVPVPDVTGKDEAEAQKILEDAGFKVENKAKYDDMAAGKVISTDPAPGIELEEGKTVTMYVSQGKERVEVPNLVGHTYDEAVAMLTELGLTPNATEEYSNKNTGEVLSQTQSAGKKVEKGSTIDFVISKGKEQAVVPGLVWATYEDALAKLSSAGLKPGNVTREYDNTGEFPEGYVMYQTQGEGTTLDKGGSVDFVVSKGIDSNANTNPPTDPDNNGENDNSNTGW